MDFINISTEKFTARQWNNIEKTTDPKIREISISMSEFGREIGSKGEYNPPKLSAKSFNSDENIYNILRISFIREFKSIIELCDEFIFDDKEKISQKNKNKKVKHGAGQDRVREIKLRKIREIIDRDISDLKNIDYKSPSTTRFQMSESGLLNYMIWCLRIKEYNNKNKKRTTRIYDAGLSLSRAIKYYSDIDNISEKLISDAKIVLVSLEKEISFWKLQTNYSDLITESTFEYLGYERCLRLYEDQYSVLKEIYSSIKNNSPKFICYTTPPGSGKTTLTVALGRLIFSMTNGEKQVIYVCYNNLVRTEVAKMLFQSNTEFAIISDCICTPHFSCYNGKKPSDGGRKKFDDLELRLNHEMTRMKKMCDKYPKVLICDLVSAQRILKKKNSDKTYIAYIDEPTSGSECPNSPMTYCYTDIMMNCPKCTVCLSATMPDKSEIPIVIDNFLKRYNADLDDVKTITSCRIPINCVAINADGFVVAPHQFVETIEDLSDTIKMINKNHFFKRFYTSYTLYDLLDKIKKRGYEKLLINDYSFDNNFKTLSDINHQNIRNYCIKLLEFIIEQQDLVLIDELKVIETKYSEIGFNQETCCTSSSYLNLGSNLIIKKDPKEFLKIAESYIDTTPKLKNIFKDFYRSKENYEKECQRIEKSNSIQGDDNSRLLSALNTPILDWDDKYVINSSKHLQNNCRNYDFSNDHKLLKHSFINQVQVDELEYLPDTYDRALMAGISIYDPSISLLKSYNDLYNDIAFSMADRSNLSYIVSNEAITYGTNLPIHKVIIDHDIDFTQNMFHQLIGRAGRLGKSKTACVVFMSIMSMKKTFSFKERNIEAENINEMAKQFI